MVPDEVPPTVRDRLVLALDVASLDEALELATRLRPWFSVAKVGLELFSAEGRWRSTRSWTRPSGCSWT